MNDQEKIIVRLVSRIEAMRKESIGEFNQRHSLLARLREYEPSQCTCWTEPRGKCPIHPEGLKLSKECACELQSLSNRPCHEFLGLGTYPTHCIICNHDEVCHRPEWSEVK